MFYFHHSITCAEAMQVARQLGCEIRRDSQGDYVIAPPLTSSKPQPKAGTQNNKVVKLPVQIRQSSPESPSAA